MNEDTHFFNMTRNSKAASITEAAVLYETDFAMVIGKIFILPFFHTML